LLLQTQYGFAKENTMRMKAVKRTKKSASAKYAKHLSRSRGRYGR